MENKLGINILFSNIMPYLKTLASWKKKKVISFLFIYYPIQECKIFEFCSYHADEQPSRVVLTCTTRKNQVPLNIRLTSSTQRESCDALPSFLIWTGSQVCGLLIVDWLFPSEKRPWNTITDENNKGSSKPYPNLSVPISQLNCTLWGKECQALWELLKIERATDASTAKQLEWRQRVFMCEQSLGLSLSLWFFCHHCLGPGEPNWDEYT